MLGNGFWYIQIAGENIARTKDTRMACQIGLGGNMLIQSSKKLLGIVVGCFLLVPISIITAAIAGAVSLGIIYFLGRQVDYFPHLSVWYFSSILLAAVTGKYAGVILARYTLRVFPIRYKNRSHWVPSVSIAVIALFTTVASLYFTVHSISAEGQPDQPKTVWTITTGLVIWWVQLGVVWNVYLRANSLLRKNSILYLRKFRSFADRATYQALLNSTTSGKNIVALVPAYSSPRDLDPYIIGFSGFKFIHPVASMPLFISTKDDDWEETVRDLIGYVDHVVIDGSTYSPSMKIEYEMLSQTKNLHKVLVLIDRKIITPPNELKTFQFYRYTRTMAQTIPKAFVISTVYILYTYLSINYPVVYPGFFIWSFLLVSPTIFQRSLGMDSVRDIRRILCLSSLKEVDSLAEESNITLQSAEGKKYSGRLRCIIYWLMGGACLTYFNWAILHVGWSTGIYSYDFTIHFVVSLLSFLFLGTLCLLGITSGLNILILFGVPLLIALLLSCRLSGYYGLIAIYPRNAFSIVCGGLIDDIVFLASTGTMFLLTYKSTMILKTTNIRIRLSRLAKFSKFGLFVLMGLFVICLLKRFV